MGRSRLEWLEFWGKLGPAILEFGQALYRQSDGDPERATEHLKRITTDMPKFQAARDETERGFAELKAEAAAQEPEAAPEGEPDNEYVDPADHAR